MDLALRTLTRCAHKNIPAPYLLQTEGILKGNRAIIWGLLYHMKLAFRSPKGFHTGSGSPRKLPKVRRSLLSVYLIHLFLITTSIFVG